jgi:hypothetical protein
MPGRRGAIDGLTGAYLAKASADVLMVDKVAEHGIAGSAIIEQGFSQPVKPSTCRSLSLREREAYDSITREESKYGQ